MPERVASTVPEHKPEGVYDDLEAIGNALGSPMTMHVNGRRAIWGGHTLAGIVAAAVGLGVDPHRDRVSIEANVGQGCSGFYVVDECGGVKEIREA